MKLKKKEKGAKEVCVWVAGVWAQGWPEEKSSSKSKLLRFNHIYAILGMFSGKLSNCWHSNLFQESILALARQWLELKIWSSVEEFRKKPNLWKKWGFFWFIVKEHKLASKPQSAASPNFPASCAAHRKGKCAKANSGAGALWMKGGMRFGWDGLATEWTHFKALPQNGD